MKSPTPERKEDKNSRSRS